MPYDRERAHYPALQRVAQDAWVQATVSRLQLQPIAVSHGWPSGCMLRTEVSATEWQPQHLVVIDGSYSEIALDSAATALLGALSIAAVTLDLQRLAMLDQQRPIEPQQFRAVYRTDAFEAVVPGAQMILKGDPRPLDSLRRVVYELLDSTRLAADGESLLDTYQALLAYKPQRGHFQRCPWAVDGCEHPRCRYQRGTGCYTCPCPRQRSLYATDALRLHEMMPLVGTNGALLTELMTVLQHLWLLHHLRTLEHQQQWHTLQSTTFMMDGPLAIFGAAGWMSRAIRLELQRLTMAAREALNHSTFTPHIVGIEKTGTFVAYFAALDTADPCPGQTVFGLLDADIKHIIRSSSALMYGHNTYYAHKLLYKTAHATRIVINLPAFDDSIPPLAAFPRLADTLALIDTLHSAQYQHAITALVDAHAAAAIPESLGQRILHALVLQRTIPL